MVRSMTGFGRAQRIVDRWDITVELRSVNHRFLEYSARVPRAYAYLEEKLKGYLKASISRGKVDVSVTIQPVSGSAARVTIDHSLAKEYRDALAELAEDLQVKNDITVSKLARFGDIFTITRVQEDEDQVWAAVSQVAQEAVERFVSMREEEGRRMEADLRSRLCTIEGLVGQVEERSPQTVEAYRNRLYNRLQEVLADKAVDQQRILTEAAIFAEKVAVDEETVRLRSHIHQFRQILDSGEPVGRKLDFLVQEFNRESNTIGSKAQDMEVARMVVDLKAEIEKIREQIQNVE